MLVAAHLSFRGSPECSHADIRRFVENDAEQRKRVAWRRPGEQRGVQHDTLDFGDEHGMLASQLILRPAKALALRSVPLGDQVLDGRTIDNEWNTCGRALVEDRERLADVAQVRRDVVLELGARDLTCAWDLIVTTQPIDDRRDDVSGSGNEQLA
jgi:hypothetical protein